MGTCNSAPTARVPAAPEFHSPTLRQAVDASSLDAITGVRDVKRSSTPQALSTHELASTSHSPANTSKGCDVHRGDNASPSTPDMPHPSPPGGTAEGATQTGSARKLQVTPPLNMRALQTIDNARYSSRSTGRKTDSSRGSVISSYEPISMFAALDNGVLASSAQYSTRLTSQEAPPARPDPQPSEETIPADGTFPYADRSSPSKRSATELTRSSVTPLRHSAVSQRDSPSTPLGGSATPRTLPQGSATPRTLLPRPTSRRGDLTDSMTQLSPGPPASARGGYAAEGRAGSGPASPGPPLHPGAPHAAAGSPAPLVLPAGAAAASAAADPSLLEARRPSGLGGSGSSSSMLLLPPPESPARGVSGAAGGADAMGATRGRSSSVGRLASARSATPTAVSTPGPASPVKRDSLPTPGPGGSPVKRDSGTALGPGSPVKRDSGVGAPVVLLSLGGIASGGSPGLPRAAGFRPTGGAQQQQQQSLESPPLYSPAPPSGSRLPASASSNVTPRQLRPPTSPAPPLSRSGSGRSLGGFIAPPGSAASDVGSPGAGSSAASPPGPPYGRPGIASGGAQTPAAAASPADAPYPSAIPRMASSRLVMGSGGGGGPQSQMTAGDADSVGPLSTGPASALSAAAATRRPSGDTRVGQSRLVPPPPPPPMASMHVPPPPPLPRKHAGYDASSSSSSTLSLPSAAPAAGGSPSRPAPRLVIQTADPRPVSANGAPEPLSSTRSVDYFTGGWGGSALGPNRGAPQQQATTPGRFQPSGPAIISQAQGRAVGVRSATTPTAAQPVSAGGRLSGLRSAPRQQRFDFDSTSQAAAAAARLYSGNGSARQLLSRRDPHSPSSAALKATAEKSRLLAASVKGESARRMMFAEPYTP